VAVAITPTAPRHNCANVSSRPTDSSSFTEPLLEVIAGRQCEVQSRRRPLHAIEMQADASRLGWTAIHCFHDCTCAVARENAPTREGERESERDTANVEEKKSDGTI
jgi:hypothetical protein